MALFAARFHSETWTLPLLEVNSVCFCLAMLYYLVVDRSSSIPDHLFQIFFLPQFFSVREPTINSQRTVICLMSSRQHSSTPERGFESRPVPWCLRTQPVVGLTRSTHFHKPMAAFQTLYNDSPRMVCDLRELTSPPMLSRPEDNCSCRNSRALRSSAKRAFFARSSSLCADILIASDHEYRMTGLVLLGLRSKFGFSVVHRLC